MRQRKSDKGDRAKERIVEEATRQFAERGLEGASLRDIGQACGIPQSTIAHHFPQKQALQEAVINSAINVIAAKFKQALRESDTVDQQIDRYIKVSVDILLSGIPEIIILDREVYSYGSTGLLDIGIKSLRENATNDPFSDLMARTGSPMLDHLTPRRLSDIIFAMIFALTKFRRLHQFDTAPSLVSKKAIVRDLTTIVRGILRPHILEDAKAPKATRAPKAKASS